MEAMSQTPPSYVLGHSQEELERLGRQAALVDPITRRFFERAGIGSGMRVLDVGTGAGHVAMIAAELVGATGQVLSVDRSATALETAQARIDAAGLKHVSLLEGDPATMDFEATFDAVVGRYVLMFQPDPVALLRGVARHVRPGGIVVFHEPDWSGVRTLPSVPLYEEACRWIVDTIDKNATESHMGMKVAWSFIPMW